MMDLPDLPMDTLTAPLMTPEPSNPLLVSSGGPNTAETSRSSSLGPTSLLNSTSQERDEEPFEERIELPRADSDYLNKVQQRRNKYTTLLRPEVKAYRIDSLMTIPHSTGIHAFVGSIDSSTFLTGGQDGYIRRYDLKNSLDSTKRKKMEYTAHHDGTMNEKGLIPILKAYWENESPDQDVFEHYLWSTRKRKSDKRSISFGAKTECWKRAGSVYSLEMNKEDLWGVSGTAYGSINLFTIRHDAGQIRHIFPSSTSSSILGHSPNSPVSALKLTYDERHLLSGGWDGKILEWDMNTGVGVHEYVGHDAQISGFEWRPCLDSDREEMNGIKVDEEEEEDDEEEEEETNGRSTRANRRGKANKVNGKSHSPATNGDGANSEALQPEAEETKEDVVDADGEADVDAEGDVDADGEEEIDDLVGLGPNTLLPSGQISTSLLPPKPSRLHSVPIMGSEGVGRIKDVKKSDDVFLSSSIDGQVLVWDRRLKEANVQRLPSSGKNSNWCASATWSTDGQQIFVGRRSSQIDIYDLRQTSTTAPTISKLKLPNISGAVSALRCLPSGKHLLSASHDNVRIWDIEKKEARIVVGHFGGFVSNLWIDPLCRYMITTSGNRGWDGSSTDTLIVHEIKSLE